MNKPAKLSVQIHWHSLALLVFALNTKLTLLQTPFWQQSGVGPLSQHGLAKHGGGGVVVVGIGSHSTFPNPFTLRHSKPSSQESGLHEFAVKYIIKTVNPPINADHQISRNLEL